MLSFSSLWVFTYLNGFLCSFSYLDYLFDHNIDIFTGITSVLLKNYIFIEFIDKRLKNIEYITPEERVVPSEKFYKEFDLYVITTSIVEVVTSLFIKKYMVREGQNIIYDLITFIPYSFCFEIIFDFFHYFGHRLSHSKYLYRYFHKLHHTHTYPTLIISFYQHPIDLFLLVTIPTWLTFYILNGVVDKPTLYMYKLIMTYKSFIEISGHSGKNPNGSSFIQFFWLPKLFGIELHTKDHDLHHTLNNCNYSKRFALWDKIFGTYK